MPFTALTADGLRDADYTPLTELPPFAAFLDGTEVRYVHLAGPVAAPGEIASMKIPAGGFRYTDIPATESGFLLSGTAVIREGEDVTELGPGDGYVLPPGFSGTFEVKEPVTKVFYVL
ncbi:cupin domain-containing protein [Blastococcus sp. SYSU D00820]